MTKTVVVLGGSLGGLAIAHRLLKNTRPREPDLRVILVSKNSHFYWNLASVRAVVPGLIPDEHLLQPIAPGLEQYPSGSVEFITGAATGVDPSAQTVTVSPAATGGSGDDTRTIAYDHLVVATGAVPSDARMPWKAAGSYDECVAALHDTAAAVAAAKHVVVAGGGATGVEVAGEIKHAYPAKEVVLVSGGASLVGGDSTAASVERELVRLGVDIRRNTRATIDDDDDDDKNKNHQNSSSSPNGGGGGKKTRVALSDGSSLLTDLYLPTTGLIPNSSFLPANLLTEKGYVDVDDYMRARAAPRIWAVGDVVCKPRAGFLITEAQAAGVAKNIDLVLQGKSPVVVRGPPVDFFMCTTGRSRGAGRAGPVPVPSFLVWAAKGRTLGVQRTRQYADGSRF